jgi:hypothetical protein
MRKKTSLLYDICVAVILFIIMYLLAYYVFGITIQSRYSISVQGFNNLPSSVELVIARYEENLSWVNNLPRDLYTKVYIYNKGEHVSFDIPNSVSFDLPNVGREGHTYLTHIVNNYDRLPDVTMFVPGSIGTNLEKMRRVNKIQDYLQGSRTSIILGHKDIQTINEANNFQIEEWRATSPENNLKKPELRVESSSDRPLKSWFEKRFHGEQINCVSFLGILAASREDIQKRPKEFYESLSKEMLHPHPETGHYIERVWKNIISMSDDKCMNV